MTRRLLGLLVTLALGLLVTPLAAEAEPVQKVFRVGLLSTAHPRSVPWFMAFEQRLRKLGYVEGHNIALEFRNAEGQLGRLPALAADLVRLPVDILVAPGPEAVLQVAQQATRTMPM